MGVPVAKDETEPQSGGFKTDLRAGTVGLPGILMQGVATIAPAFAILASFVFTVSLAGIVTPWAYLLAGGVLLLVAITSSQLAKELPSAGRLVHVDRPGAEPAGRVLRRLDLLHLAAPGGRHDVRLPGQDRARAGAQGPVRHHDPVVAVGDRDRRVRDVPELPRHRHLREDAADHRRAGDRDHGRARALGPGRPGAGRLQPRAAEPRQLRRRAGHVPRGGVQHLRLQRLGGDGAARRGEQEPAALHRARHDRLGDHPRRLLRVRELELPGRHRRGRRRRDPGRDPPSRCSRSPRACGATRGCCCCSR